METFTYYTFAVTISGQEKRLLVSSTSIKEVRKEYPDALVRLYKPLQRRNKDPAD